MTIRCFLTCLCLVMFAATSVAHDPEANPGKPQHGGQYVEYETHYGIELTTTADQLVFHMTHHLQPKDMSGSTFTVFVQTDTDTQTFKASPKGTTLVVALAKPPSPGTKIVLTGKDSNEATIQGRFVIK